MIEQHGVSSEEARAWAALYVLGALAGDEKAAFEDHLRQGSRAWNRCVMNWRFRLFPQILQRESASVCSGCWPSYPGSRKTSDRPRRPNPSYRPESCCSGQDS